MINKVNLKFYLIPAGFFFLVFLIILIVPMRNKKTTEENTAPTQIPSLFPLPSHFLTPTLIPLHFTGGNLTPDVPSSVELFSEQKTVLRRKAPLELSFGFISFDYENDIFILTLKEPKDQSQTSFNAWLKQRYPAIPGEQFAIQ